MYRVPNLKRKKKIFLLLINYLVYEFFGGQKNATDVGVGEGYDKKKVQTLKTHLLWCVENSI